MITAVWRVAGARLDVQGFLARNGYMRPDLVWRKGEKARGGRVCLDSGANILVAEHDDVEVVMKNAIKQLTRWERALQEIRNEHALSVLDLAIYVGSAKQATTQVAISPQDILRLARLGVGLTVSAYPVDEG